jgi:C-terminal processing protease CtpA/Prc
LKESKRAVLVGKRTAGAFNGFTKAFPMPEGFAALALPYTKSVSPRGRSYEGAGVTPNKVVSYTVADFGRGKDRVLQVALRVAQ